MKGEHRFVQDIVPAAEEIAALAERQAAAQEVPQSQPERLVTRMDVLPWVDELVEEQGFGPRSMYTEMCWLPVLGPTATWLYRRLGSWAEYHPGGVLVGLVDLSVGLGLGEGIGRNSKLAKAFERLERFEAAKWSGRELFVRRALAPLPQRYVERLSYSAHEYHEMVLHDRLRQLPEQQGSGNEGVDYSTTVAGLATHGVVRDNKGN